MYLGYSQAPCGTPPNETSTMSIFDRLLGNLRKPTETPGPAPETVFADRRKHKRVNARPGTRAVIIDDSPTVVAALRKVLRSAGYETREALDAEHGLTLIDQDPPELIFLDIILPGMNGFNALRTIRKQPASQHIPVIMISGNESATEQFYANRIGADDFMKKPFGRAEVFARIQALVEAGRLPPREQPMAALPEEGDAVLVEPDASVPEHELPALGIDVDGVAAAEAAGEDR